MCDYRDQAGCRTVRNAKPIMLLFGLKLPCAVMQKARAGEFFVQVRANSGNGALKLAPLGIDRYIHS
jgi:hypothetical protein